MKVSREQAAQNRERILDAAAQLFRERGFDGIGVADLMKEAGLTHGGFYGHFSSKDDLIAQASARELTRSLAHWSKVGERASGDRLSAIAALYLTSTHRDNPGAGCVLAALGPDVSRQGPAVRRAVTDYVRSVCRSSGEAGSGQIESGETPEGHQHVRNIGRRNGSRARGR